MRVGQRQSDPSDPYRGSAAKTEAQPTSLERADGADDGVEVVGDGDGGVGEGGGVNAVGF